MSRDVPGPTVPQTRHLGTAVPGPRSRALQTERDAALPDGLGRTLPIFVERMAGGIIEDVDGNRIVDLASGIAVTSVGAAHPEVARRVAAQAQRFTHTCFLVTQYEGYVRVAQWLNSHAPGDFAKSTALFSTGAEAVENAVKIARAATGRPGVVVFDNAYHGRTLFTLAMTAKDKPYKTGFGPLPTEHVHRAAFPDPLRWPGSPAPAQVADEALRAFEDLVARVGAEQIACVVVEPIQGEGGFIVPPAGFLPRLAETARRHGIVVVGDEVQAGLARTGTLFAAEHDGFVPDLVCTAKALGGGLPISAVTGRAEIMAAVSAGGLGGTYSGNPLACEAALAVFEIIDKEDLTGRARAIGQQVREALAPLVGLGRGVAELRGRGAMLALELVRPGTLEPDPDAAAAIAKACHQQGVLVLVCGTLGNVIRLLPPLVIDDDLLADALGVVAGAICEQVAAADRVEVSA
ncbi:MAG: 4-aminobutyrate--2-oxoglutarate transaminase [Intrasporangium sp.]|uniref:4-aminobutyrate--2-oxoglutarate transaminase n=1 Tax=Intrasporangium sp. TaxID=1925024 RepID=UPI002649E0C4|nr:4-aminobutyrate--2-oxoglutarate transaminase [Intrasporangium sp.]MDN5796283.1 4-aminobutyrate--2-oxoglutarate transaminase [Intrasporangium sp.]